MTLEVANVGLQSVWPCGGETWHVRVWGFFPHLLKRENYMLVSTAIFSVRRNNMLSGHNL